MHGRCWTGQVVYLADFDIEGKGNVVAHEFKLRVADQACDVAFGAGEEVVDAEDVRSSFYQPVAQVRSEKSGATRYHDGAVTNVLIHWLILLGRL